MSLNELQKDLIVGTLLGDGNLQTNNGQTWRYRAIHKAFHYLYLEHKYKILQNFCSSKIHLSKILDKRSQKVYERCTFNTVFTNVFRFYGQHFYKNEKKIWLKCVPKDIEKFLTPRVLAFWYMDDGALKWKGKSNAVRFCTDSFSKHEVELLGNALEKKFQLKITYQKKNGFLRIATSEDSFENLKKHIVPHLLPCMYYKFPNGCKGVWNDEDLSNDIINTFEPRHM